MTAVCYTRALSRYPTDTATINSVDSPVIQSIGNIFDLSFCTVEFPIIKPCYSAGNIDKPVTDYLKSGFRNCGQIRHHFLDYVGFIISKAISVIAATTAGSGISIVLDRFDGEFDYFIRGYQVA